MKVSAKKNQSMKATKRIETIIALLSITQKWIKWEPTQNRHPPHPLAASTTLNTKNPPMRPYVT